MTAQPRDAATVVLLRPGPAGAEVLLTRRPATMAFAPGVHVFPGGRVEPGDTDPRLVRRSHLPPDEAQRRLGEPIAGEAALAFFIAALREAFEEVGILLAAPDSEAGSELGSTSRADRVDGSGGVELARLRAALAAGTIGFADVCERLAVRLRTDLLVPIGRWVTPAVFPRRFDARFFAAPAPASALVIADPNEVVAHRWLAPGAAMEAMHAGELDLWLPTACTLELLEGADEIDDSQAAGHRPAAGWTGRLAIERLAPGLVRLDFPAVGGVPGRPGRGYLVGRRELVVVDPGDPSPVVLEAIEQSARAVGGRIGAIVVTRVDATHAAGAFDLGQRLGLAVHCGPGGAGWLPGPLVELADGEVVPAGDVPLRVVAPGRGDGPERGDPVDRPDADGRGDRGRIALVGDGGRIRLADGPTGGE